MNIEPDTLQGTLEVVIGQIFILIGILTLVYLYFGPFWLAVASISTGAFGVWGGIEYRRHGNPFRDESF